MVIVLSLIELADRQYRRRTLFPILTKGKLPKWGVREKK
jgi:hypothetical protein